MWQAGSRLGVSSSSRSLCPPLMETHAWLATCLLHPQPSRTVARCTVAQLPVGSAVATIVSILLSGNVIKIALHKSHKRLKETCYSPSGRSLWQAAGTSGKGKGQEATAGSPSIASFCAPWTTNAARLQHLQQLQQRSGQRPTFESAAFAFSTRRFWGFVPMSHPLIPPPVPPLTYRSAVEVKFDWETELWVRYDFRTHSAAYSTMCSAVKETNVNRSDVSLSSFQA